ncbi:NAD(P)/FAD-dependent oxidoreductase [Aestuariirhabdus litorea]|uniref:FAD-dependent oxidoreductase n=1 Tax=Aestuariirhabdus litorea TaxID=2528527 RepID=A0A3P3VMS7_9GAMM|nr:NAD(P)/FAD-dependent oxidoreductase [Aestuariirhabdus litorea]RRJ83985.1 FAD-dependent oxidoreductase [Aestuariirhabdus litorea]RWW97205.1 FAD-dependent oxidoreductase [Endozoicomonadaceae bacterium GTF-13]
MGTDLAIIGAGPAGMAAAIEAQALGLSTQLLDEQARVGGQIYRNIERAGEREQQLLGPDYLAGRPLAEQLHRSGTRYSPGATVWQIDPEGALYYTSGGRAFQLQPRHILIATGAQERPMPIPGWELPGVMTAGAAQILLKSPGLLAQGAVFAGSGPLLYLVANQYLRAGVKIQAVLDTTPLSNYLRALARLPQALRGLGYLAKGISLLVQLQRSGVPLVRGVTGVEALAGANGLLERVRYRTRGATRELATEHLFLHQGVIPNSNLAMASGCRHHWSETQLCWLPERDPFGQSSLPHISIAGDGSGIGGARASALQGRLAAQQIACRLGLQEQGRRDRQCAPLFRALGRELGWRPFLETLYRPAVTLRLPQGDNALVCRCEEVRVADIRAALAQGCVGPNQLKSFTRCGMGSCQGRQCSLSVTELIANELGLPPGQVGHYRVRAPVKPLTLGELAALQETPPAEVIDPLTAPPSTPTAVS